MGIRSRVKKTLEKIRVLAQVIHEESKYPGRPQPHVAAQNPLWGGGDSREDANLQTKTKTKTNAEQASSESVHSQDTPISGSNECTEIQEPAKETKTSDQGSLNEEGADYWFLQYDDVEGWNESNPGQQTSPHKTSPHKTSLDKE